MNTYILSGHFLPAITGLCCPPWNPLLIASLRFCLQILPINSWGRAGEREWHEQNCWMMQFSYTLLLFADNTTVLTEKHLNLVREKLAKQWKHCARKLGFSEPEIDEIDHDYERDGLKEKVYQMLLKWEMREGSKGATVGKLAKALFGCQRLDLLSSLMQIQEE